ncbi:mannitol dehydrogenase family protein [Atopococcus tabaci]|uniref:mannitol dehydrogenase family protein n=1 Tax=Atopococcus tabaci TaxID=269774 RepID=UPI002409E257|nr:mannitol dehydrogenase family protein [Atopococcus tabaci]
MKLNNEALAQSEWWKEKGYAIPEYDRKQVARQTKEAPVWLHLGAGNIFRAFPAMLQQTLLNKGLSDKGIVVAEGYDYEIIQKAYQPYDDLNVFVKLKGDGTVEKTVIGSVVESLEMDSGNKEDFSRLKKVFANGSLQLVSFTITEKGYSLVDGKGNVMQSVLNDFENGPDAPESYIGKLTALLYARYQNGAAPLALVSMDNVSHNGSVLQQAVLAYAKKWTENGKVELGFKEYVSDSSRVSFPWTMIDKITPRPDSVVQQRLEEDGVEGMDVIVTARHSYTAPFVNAEEAEYLVVEDQFPNGRPPLEEAGVIFTDRETVDKAETMKVTTCLNPLHTALAIFGCLLGHTSIHEEMQDADLNRLVEKIGYQEGLPVVVDPGILNPKAFLDEVVQERFTNPFVPDTPQRIATDTSQLLSIRFGKTIQAYAAREDLNVADLTYIPLTLAGWCRYLMGIGDDGERFEWSPDPLLDELTPKLQDVQLGAPVSVHETLRPILERSDIFGVDLYAIGLAEKVERYFEQMIQGTGAVRNTLQETLG